MLRYTFLSHFTTANQKAPLKTQTVVHKISVFEVNKCLKVQSLGFMVQSIYGFTG